MSNTSTKKNGSVALATRSSGTPEIEDATNSPVPTGGVNEPIAKFATINIPKNTGSTLNLIATGTKIGAKIVTAELGFNNIPTINSNAFTSNKKIRGL